MKDIIAIDEATVKRLRKKGEATLDGPENRLEAALRAGVSWFITISFFFIPLTFYPGLADSFTLPKVIMIRFMIGVALILWLARLVVARRVEWIKTPLDIPVGALMVTVFMSALFSVDRLLSLYGNYKRYEDIFSLVGYGLLYFIVTNNFKAKDMGRILTATLTASVLVSIYAIAQYVGIDPIKTGAVAQRATATMGNAVFLGTYLAFFLAIAIGRFTINEMEGKKRAVYFGLTLILAIGLVVTFSRAAWVGLGFGLSVLVVLKAREMKQTGKNRSTAARWLLVSLAVVIMSFVVVNYYHSQTAENGLSVVDRALSTVDTDNATVRTRLILWRSTLSLALKRPLLGYGPDTLIGIYPRHLPDSYKKIEPQARIDKAHNELINIAATLGFLGLAVFLAIVVWSWRVFWTRYAQFRLPDAPGLIAGLLAYLVAVQFSFSQVETAIFFWLGLSLAMVSLGALETSAPVRLESQLTRGFAWSFVAVIGLIFTVILIVFSIQPAIADYHFQRGLRAEERGQLREARAQFTLAADISQVRSLYYFRLGRRLQIDATAGDRLSPELIRQSLGAYANAEKLDRNNANVYIGLGSLYTSLSRDDERFSKMAREAFKRSLALNKYVPEAYIDIGVLEAQEGRYAIAASNFRKALGLDPGNQTARNNLVSLRDHRQREIAR
ncbi:MAG TPA: hypothetical protein ENI11_01875 [Actinobacteria bacterium]|nr:hypothetical protein [Actinomycetota bacterium]